MYVCNVVTGVKHDNRQIWCKFPDIAFEVISTDHQQVLASQSLVFTVPVVQILLNGQEVNRFARGFSLHQVEKALERIVTLSA